MTLTEIRFATAELVSIGRVLAPVECLGETLWFDPTVSVRTTREHPAYLLSTFDEAALTYAQLGFTRRDHDADRTRLVAQTGGGIVVIGNHDVGAFKRKVGTKAVTVTIRPEVDLTAAERDGVAEAAEFLADFHELPLNLVLA